MKIAVPSDNPGGLEATISEHFGHCDAFTLIDVEEQEVKAVNIMPNTGHVQGGCMAPVMMLKNAEVDTMVAHGMGMRPLAGFQQVGIEVFFSEQAPSVGAVVDMIIKGEARKFGPAQTCGGGGGQEGGGCQGEH